MTRLPTPGADQNQWGHMLNDFLSVEHNDDGTLKRAGQIDSAEQSAHKGRAGGYAGLDATTRVPATQLAGDGANASMYLRGDRSWAPLAELTSAILINVKDFEVKGDGQTDDTAALQAAIDETADRGGGVVFIPVGTYLVDPSKGLNLKSDIKLQGAGAASVFKVADGKNVSGNIMRVEARQRVVLRDFTIDGNNAHQSGSTNYGLYIAQSLDCQLHGVRVTNTSGTGIHVYDSSGCVVRDCLSQNNTYHGFEAEQIQGCVYQGNRGSQNQLHGLLISPGEVGGQGSRGNSFIGNTFDHNKQYGIAANAANGDTSPWLCTGNLIQGCVISDNGGYGLAIYKQDTFTIQGNYLAHNQYMGIYLAQSQNNTVIGNTLLENAQQGSNTYDEILLEGYEANHDHPAKNNTISHNMILITGSTKARWGINEASEHDGPNTITDNRIPVRGTKGDIQLLCPADVLRDSTGAYKVNTQLPSLTKDGTMAFFVDEKSGDLKVAVRNAGGITKTGVVSLS